MWYPLFFYLKLFSFVVAYCHYFSTFWTFAFHSLLFVFNPTNTCSSILVLILLWYITILVFLLFSLVSVRPVIEVWDRQNIHSLKGLEWGWNKQTNKQTIKQPQKCIFLFITVFYFFLSCFPLNYFYLAMIRWRSYLIELYKECR